MKHFYEEDYDIKDHYDLDIDGFNYDDEDGGDE